MQRPIHQIHRYQGGQWSAMKFYDTSALLDLSPDTLLAEPFLIADITLYELEDIKTNGKKDESTKKYSSSNMPENGSLQPSITKTGNC